MLTINGDKNDNVINVIEDTHNVHVETSTLPEGTITQQDFTGITQIKINGGDGETTPILYQGNTVGADIHGDNGTTPTTARLSSMPRITRAGRKGGSNGGGSNKGGSK